MYISSSLPLSAQILLHFTSPCSSDRREMSGCALPAIMHSAPQKHFQLLRARRATNEAALKIWSELSRWLYCPCSDKPPLHSWFQPQKKKPLVSYEPWQTNVMYFATLNVVRALLRRWLYSPTQRGLRLPQLPCAQWNQVIFPSISAFFSWVERSQWIPVASE